MDHRASSAGWLPSGGGAGWAPDAALPLNLALSAPHGVNSARRYLAPCALDQSWTNQAPATTATNASRRSPAALRSDGRAWPYRLRTRVGGVAEQVRDGVDAEPARQPPRRRRVPHRVDGRPRLRYRLADPVERLARIERGIPMIGGAQGAIPGTVPHRNRRLDRWSRRRRASDPGFIPPDGAQSREACQAPQRRSSCRRAG